MIDPVVREATTDDAASLSALSLEARDSLIDVRGGARWLATHPDPFATSDDHGGPTDDFVGPTVLVAVLDDVIVGYLVVKTGRDIATIDEVYVTPEARELGFGDELLAHAVSIGRAAGCRYLEAEALPGDRETKNLYERAGIKARLITVSTAL